MIYNTFYYEKKLKNVKTNPVSAAYHRVEYKPNHLHIKKGPAFLRCPKIFRAT